MVWKFKDFVNWSFDGLYIVGFDWYKGYEYVNVKGEKKMGYFCYWVFGRVVEKNGEYYFYIIFVKLDENVCIYVLKFDCFEGFFFFVGCNFMFFYFLDGFD